MIKKVIVGAGFKMRKSVKDSIDYVEKVYNFIAGNKSDTSSLEIFILASFEALYPMAKIVSDKKVLKLGAQNCWHEDRGPYTGEVSPKNLKEIGCTYVEVGHPERRYIFNESGDLINKKIKACIRNDLKPILFIGERQKHDDKSLVYSFLKKQLLEELEGLNIEELNNVVLAYEPIWAIGAKDAAPVEYIEDSLIFLRKFFRDNFGDKISEGQPIFYGGSVKPENALEILKVKGNDGISSGRGAMEPEYFIDIINISSEFVKNK